MWPILVAGIAVAVIIVLVIALRRANSPSVGMMQDVREAVLSLQAVAATQITEVRADGQVLGVSLAAMERQTQRVRETIRFVYTIERDGEQVIHTVSSQLLARKPEKYQIQCMLVALLTLSQQLESAGIDPKTVPFNINRSELGTHFVALALTPDQNAKLLAQRSGG